MKELVYKQENFNLEKFLESYELNLKNIFSSLEDEELKYIIDVFNKDDLTIEANIEGKGIDQLLSTNKGIFLLIGGIADENSRYFRLIDGIQYRVSHGEFYEHSTERFHDFEVKEELLNIGNINFEVEISLGLALSIEGDNIVINFSQIKEDSNGSYLEYIEDSGDLGNLILNYLNKNII